MAKAELMTQRNGTFEVRLVTDIRIRSRAGTTSKREYSDEHPSVSGEAAEDRNPGISPNCVRCLCLHHAVEAPRGTFLNYTVCAGSRGESR